MHPFNQWILLIAAAAVVVVAACLVIAWLDIAIHRTGSRPNPRDMRRYMLCGIYCNPDDPRPVVHRPLGWGYTLNLRREQIVVTLIVMVVLAMAAAALMYALPQSQ